MSPDDLPRLRVTVPDDPRELDRDAQMLRRERRAAANRRRMSALLVTRRWRRYGVAGPLAAAGLVLIAIVGSLLALSTPSRPRPPGQLPVAAATAPVGSAGGLLPDAALRLHDGLHRVVDLRPALVALLPTPCHCPTPVANAVSAGQEFGLRTVLVTAPAGAVEADALSRTAGRGLAVPAVDAAGTLAWTYPGIGVMLLLVARDGVVVHVVRDLGGARLEPLVQDVTGAG